MKRTPDLQPEYPPSAVPASDSPVVRPEVPLNPITAQPIAESNSGVGTPNAGIGQESEMPGVVVVRRAVGMAAVARPTAERPVTDADGTRVASQKATVIQGPSALRVPDGLSEVDAHESAEKPFDSQTKASEAPQPDLFPEPETTHPTAETPDSTSRAEHLAGEAAIAGARTEEPADEVATEVPSDADGQTDIGGGEPPIDDNHNTASGSPEDSEPTYHYPVAPAAAAPTEDTIIIDARSPLAGAGLEVVTTGQKAPDVDAVYPRQIIIQNPVATRPALRAHTEVNPEAAPGSPEANAPPSRLVVDSLAAPLPAVRTLVNVALDTYVRDATKRLTEPVPDNPGYVRFTDAAQDAGLPGGTFSQENVAAVFVGDPQTGLHEIVLADELSANAARAGRVTHNLIANTVSTALADRGQVTTSIRPTTVGDSTALNAIRIQFRPAQLETPAEPTPGSTPMAAAPRVATLDRWAPRDAPHVLRELAKMKTAGQINLGPEDLPPGHRLLRSQMDTLLDPTLPDSEIMDRLGIDRMGLDGARMRLLHTLQANPRLARLQIEQPQAPVPAEAVGSQLKAWAMRSDMTQRAIAEAAGVSQTVVNNILNGRRYSDPAVVEQIMRVMGMPASLIDQLLDDYGRRTGEDPS